MQSQLLIDEFIFRWLRLFPWLWTELGATMRRQRATLGVPYRAGRLSIFLSSRPKSSALV